MNRFPTTRRNQILAWTGAALAWGTTFLASKVEPDRVEQDEAQAVESPTAVPEAMPQVPESGLTIIRYRSQEPARTEQALVPVAVANLAPADPQPAAAAPAPASSGS